MLTHSPTCPQCGLADKAYKVSLLYLEGSARLQHNEQDHQPELDGLLRDLCVDPNSTTEVTRLLNWLNQSFAPPETDKPAGAKPFKRTISPDVVVTGFGLVALLLTVQVAIRQPGNLPTAIMILGAALLIYLAARRGIVQRYKARLSQEQAEQQREDEATSRWMRLYYCSRDQGVFDPELNRLVSVEQIQHLLYDA